MLLVKDNIPKLSDQKDGKVCPHCNSTTFVRSRRRRWEKLLLAWRGPHHYQCCQCGYEFYAQRSKSSLKQPAAD